MQCICINCGKSFKPKTKNYKAKFCSYKCNALVNGYRKGHIFIKGGEKGWIKRGQRLSRKTEFKSRGKNGRYKSNQGYILIYKPEHPYANSSQCVQEHRLVIEKYTGRYLTKDEVVHHKNRIKDDNRIENLILINKKKHAREHWDMIEKKFTSEGLECQHIPTDTKMFNLANKWLKVGVCGKCNNFIKVNRPEGVWEII